MKPSRSRSAAFGFAVAVGLCSGCVMPDQLSQLQQDMTDVKQQLRRIERDRVETEQKLAALESHSEETGDEVTREELAEMQVQIRQFSRQVERVTERMNDIDQRLDGYSQELERSRDLTRLEPSPAVDPFGSEEAGSPRAGAGGPTDVVPDPEALYNTAYADFSKGNFALAISGFREYQQRFPASALADNALYWIAECHFSQGDFRGAVEVLDALLDGYPESDKAAAANLKKALAFLEQNQVGKAIVQLRYVVSAYPDTDEARLARDKLTSLGASPS